MKKTIQTIMTAAAFAAALGAGAGDTITAQFAAESVAADSITTVPQTTYGPPGWMMTTEELEETGTTTESTPLITEGTVTHYELDTTTSSTTTTVTLEGTSPLPTDLVTDGVAPAYNEPGDFDNNGSFDARDLTLLKRYLLSNKTTQGSAVMADIDLNGEVNKKDVEALLRLLTGKPEEEDQPFAETEMTTQPTAPITTTTDVTRPTYMVLYGPPAAWE